jgi:peptidoglycan/LPS O-acetylase OafA/YrhL
MPDVDAVRPGPRVGVPRSPAGADLARPGGADPASTPDDPAPPGRRFREELHGLRGVAIGLVVVFHVWVGRTSGGVDVFLFISAFLLTGTMARRLARGDRVDPPGYWAHAFKRLLAPALVVVFGTLALVRAFMPTTTHLTALADAAGSLLHVENWVLISRSTDYYAAGADTSAFQHFWSLSVQGQIFVLWPLLMAGAGILARTLHLRPQRVLAVAFAVVGLASFVWSVYSTATQQTVAYFDTAARAWEFAAGSLLALALPSLERRMARSGGRTGSRGVRGLRIAAGWVGLLGLISCGLVLDVQGGFPGWIALWPLVCAALVIVAGRTGRSGADALLSSRPAAFLGDISYALYLVHWPMVVVWRHLRGGTGHAGLLDGAILIALAVVCAWALTRLVDAPVRRWRWANARTWRQTTIALATLALGLAPIATAHHALLERGERRLVQADQEHPGARVLRPGADGLASSGPVPLELVPDGAVVGQDWVAAPQDCTGDLLPRDQLLAKACGFAPAGASADGPADGPTGGRAPLLVVAGNSRMQQQAGALIPLAQDSGWDVITLWKGSCPFQPDVEHRLAECNDFNEALLHYLEDVDAQAVATTTTIVTYDGREAVIGGMQDTLPRLVGMGIDVLAVRDQPRFPEDPNACLEDHEDDPNACEGAGPGPLTAQRADKDLVEPSGDGAAPGQAGTIHPVDLTEVYCPDGTCPPAIGNVRVYLDADHISATYSRSTDWLLREQLEDTGWDWER